MEAPSTTSVPCSDVQDSKEQEEPCHPVEKKTGPVIGFQLPDESMFLADFSGRQPPFGMDLAKGIPVLVRRIVRGGHAAQIGVQEGWAICSVNDESMSGLSFTE